MSETLTALPETLLTQFRKEKLVLLGTVDADTRGPAMNAISWVYALNDSTIRFAVDQRSKIVSNVRENPNVSLTLFGANTVYAVYGTVELIAESLDQVPFKLACFDIRIQSVRDAMFYGARIAVEPEYEKTYDQRAADKLDDQVFEAMKKA